MLKQRIVLRQISSEECKRPTTGFLAIRTDGDIEFACGGCGKTLLMAKRARLHNVIAFCTDCNTSNGLQA